MASSTHSLRGLRRETGAQTLPSHGVDNQDFVPRPRHETRPALQDTERWRVAHPKVAELLEDGIDTCLNVRALAPRHRSRLSTTNALERLHQ